MMGTSRRLLTPSDSIFQTPTLSDFHSNTLVSTTVIPKPQMWKGRLRGLRSPS